MHDRPLVERVSDNSVERAQAILTTLRNGHRPWWPQWWAASNIPLEIQSTLGFSECHVLIVCLELVICELQVNRTRHSEDGAGGEGWDDVALQDGWEVYFLAITGDPPQPGVKKVDGIYELP